MQTRSVLLCMLFLCNLCLYLARSNISVAIVFMFEDSSALEGNLLSAFYWGYMIFQIPGGIIATRIGAKPVLTCAVLIWSISTLLGGAFGQNVALIFVLRVLVGIAEGVNYPSQSLLISRWIPADERSAAWGCVISGEPAGTIIALLGGPWIAHALGWRSIFYISGMVSIVWLVLFRAIVYSDPLTHPRISEEEKEIIHRSRPPIERNTAAPPVREILTNPRFIAIVAVHMCYNFGYYMVLSWVAKFFQSEFNVSYRSLGTLSIMPYITVFLASNAAGKLADMVESRTQISATTLRKIFNTVGMGGAALFFFLLSREVQAGHTSKGPLFSCIYLTAAVGIGGAAGSGGYWPALSDLSVEYSQVVVAFSNSIATIPGILSGAVVGYILSSTGNDWSAVFSIAAIVEVVGAVIFLLFASAEDQHFGAAREKDPLLGQIQTARSKGPGQEEEKNRD